jgi:hypothetical protein
MLVVSTLGAIGELQKPDTAMPSLSSGTRHLPPVDFKEIAYQTSKGASVT